MSGRVTGLLLAFALVSVPVSAQVEIVAMRTPGISCGTCAAVSEINLRRLVTGINKVAISRSKETVIVSYKPGAPFDLQAIRNVLEPLDVRIAQIQISAKGHVKAEGTKLLFVAGSDTFVLAANPNGPELAAAATPIQIEGVLNDRVTPMQLRPMTSKPAAP